MAIDWENLTRQQFGVVMQTLVEALEEERAARVKLQNALSNSLDQLDESMETWVRDAVAQALRDPATARALWSQRRKPSVVK